MENVDDVISRLWSIVEAVIDSRVVDRNGERSIFSDIGLDSVQFVELIGRIEDAFEIDIDLVDSGIDIVETIADLSCLVRGLLE